MQHPPQGSSESDNGASPPPHRPDSVGQIQWLLLIALTFYLATPDSRIDDRQLVAGLLAVYAGLIVVFRLAQRRRPRSTLALLLQTWAMLLVITLLLWQSGRYDSPLLGLYLLPLLASALSFARPLNVAHTGTVIVCYVGLAAAGGADVATLGFASGALAGLVPLVLAAFVVARLSSEVELAKRRIHTLSETDELTGLWNMRAFNRVHRREHQHAVRYSRPYSIMMLDMDNLKEINDTYGHNAGNRALQGVARSLARITRVTDAVARFGGDEFIVLLHEADRHMAADVAARSRMMLEATEIELEQTRFHAYASVGYASFPADGGEPDELIALADRRMYADKRRNRATASRAASPEDAAAAREGDVQRGR